ncbi:MAG: hypothetical protein JF584_02425 [Acidobacteria bacterium]|nr:hypothetical protein [Acidobacteriota bacterium]
MYVPLKSLRAALLFAAVATASAYAQPGHGQPPPGHGGIPPGQAKKMDRGDLPPGQAKKMDWRFRGDEREHFRGYYEQDARRWQRRHRPNFYAGYAIPRTYVVQTVPPAYYSGLQPPPPGYRYGYYEGYVVAYNPTTRVIADVVDLVGALSGR